MRTVVFLNSMGRSCRINEAVFSFIVSIISPMPALGRLVVLFDIKFLKPSIMRYQVHVSIQI